MSPGVVVVIFFFSSSKSEETFGWMSLGAEKPKMYHLLDKAREDEPNQKSSPGFCRSGRRESNPSLPPMYSFHLTLEAVLRYTTSEVLGGVPRADSAERNSPVGLLPGTPKSRDFRDLDEPSRRNDVATRRNFLALLATSSEP
ncbi:hypothetical protein B0H16DRAFT_1458075 [Mycena metata]|uniref:Uncharacterized protein n=1 Tax=Mycena metata TaxID=1033252 RepID=A0AAD7J3Z1_9AGAR|nr:hypothetical protein B0H16DRAFT_1458075 [Mycena metata]